jgi:hypothetical protein
MVDEVTEIESGKRNDRPAEGDPTHPGCIATQQLRGVDSGNASIDGVLPLGASRVRQFTIDGVARLRFSISLEIQT